jgi:hypothetical protein
MTTGATGQLGLALPVQGELSGTWGNTVNNGITEYTNIAIAATLTLTNDGAVTLANTTGDASATNIVSSLTGAGTVTAQFAIVKVTGTLTTPKIITAPSYSKTYLVVNAATGSTVSFIRSGQTPAVSIAVGESAYVYYNGTDYVKVAGTAAVTSFTAGTTGFTPSTATTGAITLAGTLASANGGTGVANGANNTVTFTGNYTLGLTLSANTTVTLPTTGTLGYQNIPQNSQSAAYTTVAADTGKCIFHPASDANARTFTIDSNANVPYALGTVIQFINMSANNVTIAITSDTLTWAQGGGSGSRTLAQYGVANCVKVGTTQWLLTGTNVT